MDNFAKCKEIAIAVSEGIPEGEIIYGLYFPLTPEDTWDSRWKGCKFFTHFWVEYANRIIDLAKEQFGEPQINVIPNDDIRYVKVGKYEGGKTIPVVDEPIIQWGTYRGTPLKAVSIIWSGYTKYLELLESVRHEYH